MDGKSQSFNGNVLLQIRNIYDMQQIGKKSRIVKGSIPTNHRYDRWQ